MVTAGELPEEGMVTVGELPEEGMVLDRAFPQLLAALLGAQSGEIKMNGLAEKLGGSGRGLRVWKKS